MNQCLFKIPSGLIQNNTTVSFVSYFLQIRHPINMDESPYLYILQQFQYNAPMIKLKNDSGFISDIKMAVNVSPNRISYLCLSLSGILKLCTLKKNINLYQNVGLLMIESRMKLEINDNVCLHGKLVLCQHKSNDRIIYV